MNHYRHYRQGDVLIVATDRIPEGAQPVARDSDGAHVLAWGEVTGHRHAIHDAHANLLALTDEEVADRFLTIVGGAATLVHEEHTRIDLPPGNYRVRIQREYRPEANILVAD